jgi:hypothetical protein
VASKKAIQKAGESIELGPLVFDSAMLKTLAPIEATKTGIKVADDRQNLLVNHGTADAPRYIAYTMSVFIQREALDDSEAAEVDATAADRDAAKAKRDADEQAKREREVKRAMELGIEAANSAARFERDAVAAGFVRRG